jgi:hypothetical protein
VCLDQICGGKVLCLTYESHGARGAFVGKILAKHGILLVVNLCNDM